MQTSGCNTDCGWLHCRVVCVSLLTRLWGAVPGQWPLQGSERHQCSPPIAGHTSCRNGQKLEIFVLSSPVSTRMEAGFTLLHVSDQSSCSPSISSAGEALLAPEQQAHTWAGLAVLSTLRLAFGHSEGGGALQIPPNPSSISPAGAAAPGKVLYPWRDCHSPWRVKQQLPSPWQQGRRAAACTSGCWLQWGVLVSPASHESPGFPQEMSRDSAENDAFQ